jgi:hypothetical protein
LKVYSPVRIKTAIHQRWAHFSSNQRWRHLIGQIHRSQLTQPEQRPVIFFNASTRLQSISQNAAYSLLVSLGLRVQGVPVLYFVCKGGIQRCILGSNRDDVNQAPPCTLCIRQSRQVFSSAPVTWLEPGEDIKLKALIHPLSLVELVNYKFQEVPLGFWAVNSLRWVLRRHTLMDDKSTRTFMRSFILSAWNVYQQFLGMIDKHNPQAVVVFNGMFFPEAAVRQACLDRGVKVITHEVGIQPLTAFFTEGEATAYPLDIPREFELSPAMQSRLDDYLQRRFKGDFTMAGIKFWPKIETIAPSLKAKAAAYKKIIPIFTNVIFDTSQVHANTIFPDMFVWLDEVKQAAYAHPDSLFIVRAHPDEGREGKESRESVAQWVERNSLHSLPNITFIGTDEMISSYELIRQAHFVMVYNSTIGLEAILLGKLVLTAAKSRYTQLPTTLYPPSRADYLQKLDELLATDSLPVPTEYTRNARRFLYKQLFMSSLPFEDFLQQDKFWKGYVTLNPIGMADLMAENSETLRTINNAILHGKPFELNV